MKTLSLLAFALLTTNAHADPAATRMDCFALTWTAHCQSHGKCDPPPPLPLMPIGSVSLVVTEGSGWVGGEGQISKVFKLADEEITFYATGSYSMNKDGSGYIPGIALSFSSANGGLSVSTNGPVRGTFAALNAAKDTPHAGDGSYSHSFADVNCSLR